MSSIEQGFILMLVGIAVVFVFLISLVFITKLLSYVVLRFFPEKEKPAAKKPSDSTGSKDAEIAAAIAAATAFSKR